MKTSIHPAQIMLSKTFTLAAIAALSLCCGCEINFNSGVKGSGVLKTETRQVAQFDKVKFDGIGTLNLSFGETNSLEVSGDDNLLPMIETTVSDGTLHIRPTESINPKSDLVFNVVTSELSEVAVAGAADLNIKDAACDSLKVTVSGAADMTGNGTVTDLAVSISGAGSVSLKDMKSENAKVSVSGAASASVYASKSFDGSISGVGSITCHGNPEDVEKSTSGVGSIKVVE
ncbi:MAG: head GIN domain-containing protein [Mariniblastus sp.]